MSLLIRSLTGVRN